MRVPFRRLLPPALLLPLLAACGDAAPSGGTPTDDVPVGGTLILVLPGGPSTFLPAHASTLPSKQVGDLVYERLVEIGPGLNTIGTEGFEPGLADRWTWSADSLQLTFHLDDGARWHDGRPVVAEDVRRTFELVRDPATGANDRTYLERVDSITTPDARSVTFWFDRRYPEQFFDAGARVSILPSHLLTGVTGADLRFHDLAKTPMGSGRFRFERAVAGSGLVLVADTAHHLGRPALDRIVMSVAPNFTTATAQLFAGEADVFEALRLENMAEAAVSPHVVVERSPSTAYSFVAFNFRDPSARSRPHPILAEHAMRRAIAMAVDRQALVKAVLDSLGVVGSGPHPRAMPEADTTVQHPAYAPAAAAALLDSLGWRDADGDGVREKDGRRLSFTLLSTVASAIRQRMALLLQQQLASAGVEMTIRELEFTVFNERMAAGDFDLVFGSWVMTDGSPSSLLNTWHSDGTQNHGRYSNPAFDVQIDSGTAAFDRAERRAHLGRAFRTIAQDVPAIWVYEPHNVIGVHRRFRRPPLRSVNWWLDLHRWSVPLDQRLERDRPTPIAAEQP